MRITIAFACLAGSLFGQSGYQKPPKEILDVLNAPRTPQAILSPARTHLLLVDPVGNPSITDIAKPMLRLGGLRIDPANNGAHLTQYAVGASIKALSGGAEQRVALPAGVHLSSPRFSGDGKHVAVLNSARDHVELWVIEVATAKAKRIEGVAVNATTMGAFDWMPDGRSLLVKTVPAGRGPAPVEAEAPVGPATQESSGRAAPVRTNPDMIRNPHEERQFEYYTTSQLMLVDAVSGAAKAVGKPDLWWDVDPAPDGKHLLTRRIRKPFSYLYPATSFPRDFDVIDLAGNVVFNVAKLPLADRVPIGGVSTGPRDIQWHPTQPATLYWVEALDGGNPKEKVPHRDKLMRYQVPTRMAAAEVAKTEHRMMGLDFGDTFALMSDYERDKRWLRTYHVPLDGSRPPKLLFERNQQDRYKDPGRPVEKTLQTGQRVIMSEQDSLFLSGSGASPKGDQPFLDRYSVETGTKQRLFQSDPTKYQTVVGLLEPDGSKLLIQSESPTEPPNYFIRDAAGKLTAVTQFKDPAPQVRGITKQRVTYQRADGVPLSMTLYLPPGYKAGTRLPAFMWAYPLEYNDADTAGQITGSTNRFTAFTGGASHLYLLLAGYAILDNASLPVIGDPETANNTYLEQVVAGAKAAIDKVDAMGVVDRNRVGVGGHSYGGFMTANLLAHSDLFRAGVARSGAYNRTLTPFGFQSERRTFWEAQDIYVRMSPFFAAQKINEPILFIHGEADNNQGTFPIQSERMYQAVRGNGGTTRLVMLPHESHGYSAKESIEHTLYETVTWLDKYVKNARADGLGSSGQ